MKTFRYSQAARAGCASIGCLIALLVPAIAGRAEARTVALREQARIAVEEFRREQPQAKVVVSPATGLVRSLAGLCGPDAPACDGIDAAGAFLARHRVMLLGDRAPEELQISDVHALSTSTHVQYQQVYRGLPVWGARLAVHTDAHGQVRMLQGSIRPQLQLETTPLLSAAVAIDTAKEAIGPARLRGEPKAALGILPLPEGSRLAYRVEIPTFQPVDWRVEVDARSGAILKKSDLLMHAAGQGLVVDENLLTTPQPVSRPFPDLDGSGFLKGAFADVWSFDKLQLDARDNSCWEYRKRLSRAQDLRFMAPPDDPRFDEQMLYYQVNRAHDYFRRTFGFTGRDHSFKVFAHVPVMDAENCRAQGPMDNAFYSPAADAIYFGDGTGVVSIGSLNLGGFNPTSRDGDVICHEYTHAVMGRIVPDLSGEPEDLGNALQEGYADYFACTINDDPDMGEYTVNNAMGLRNLGNSHRYPEDVNDPETGKPERHWTGMIWGGACWDLHQKLGIEVADQVIFHSMYYLPNDGSATFATAAQGLLEADGELYGGAHEAAIRQVMVQRGILEPAPHTADTPVRPDGRG